MLSNAQQNELSTLYSIHQGETSIKSLSKNLLIPKNTIKSYIYKLNDELNSQLGIKDYIQTSKQGIISIQNKYTQNRYHYFNQLKLKYLKQSHEFNILVTLATKGTITQKHLAKKLILSRSYISRLIKKCNKKMGPFGIQIVEIDDKLCFEGNEVAIRLYLYLFLSDSFQVIEWPFEDIDIEKLQDILPLKFQSINQSISHTKKTFVHILFAILQKRLKQKQIVPTPKKPVHDILELIQQNFYFTTELQQIFSGEQSIDDEKNEALYFNFFIRIFVPDMITTTKNIQLGEKFATSNLEITNFAIDLTSKIEQTFELSLSKCDYYLFVYYLTILYTFYQIFEESCSFFMNLRFQPKQKAFEKNETKKKIELLFHEFCLKSEISLSLPSPGDSVDSFFCQIIYNLVDMNLSSKLNIYVQLSQDFTSELLVTKKLQTIFNSNDICITNNFSRADLLITDIGYLENVTIPTYYLNSTADLEQWNDLLSFIKKIILMKFFST